MAIPRVLLCVAGALVALALPVQAGAKNVGALTQLRGRAGCVGDRDAKGCTHARIGGQIASVAISPESRNAYVSAHAGSVSVFTIKHGALHQLRGRAGCVSRSFKLGCTRVPELTGAGGVTISPDGRNAYVGTARGVVEFTRDGHTGALRFRGCLNARGTGRCATLHGIPAGVGPLAVSRDGLTLYATASVPTAPFGAKSAIAVFARNQRSGALRQLAGSRGCVNTDGSDGCARARALFGCWCGLAVSRDSKNVYVSSSRTTESSEDIGLAAFSRSSTGTLTQLAGTAGCATKDGADGCAATAFSEEYSVNSGGDLAVSPDGSGVYLAHESTFPEAQAGCLDNFVARLKRDAATGALGPLTGETPACGLSMTMSPDGGSLYTVSFFLSLVYNFARNPQGGSLRKNFCLTDSDADSGDDYCKLDSSLYLQPPQSITVSPDGRYAYLAAGEIVHVFSRVRI